MNIRLRDNGLLWATVAALTGLCSALMAMPDGKLRVELVPFDPLQAVGRTATPPVLDGTLDDACWQRAVVLTDLTDNGGDGRIKDQGELRLCYDDTHLYFGFFQQMSDLGELQIRHRTNGTNIWTDSYFEMQFDVAGEHKTGYPQILVNAEGYVFHRDMTPGIKTRARLGQAGYWIEGSIPFAELYKSSEIERIPAHPAPGERWGFNLCGQASATGEYFCWSNTRGLFRKWAMLGDIVFVESAPTVRIPPPPARHGDQEMSIRLTNNAARAQTFTLTATVRPAIRKGHGYFVRRIRGDDVAALELEAEACRFRQEASLAAGETKTVKLKYRVAEASANDLTISIAEAASGQQVYRARYNVPPEVEVYPVYNFYRDRLRVLVSVYTADVPSRTVTVSVVDGDGKSVRSVAQLAGESREVAVDLNASALAAGPCTVTAEVGPKAQGTATFTIPERPAKPGRIGVTDQQFLTLHGKPTLILCLMTRQHATWTPALRKEVAKAGFSAIQAYWTAWAVNAFPDEQVFAQIADEPSGYMKTTGQELVPRYLKRRAGTWEPALAVLDNFVGVQKIRSWAMACDIVSSDPYPWPATSLYHVGDWVDRSRAAVLGAKPVFAALQAFDNAFDGTGMPTPAVLRAMSYVAVIHRVNGIQYFIYEHHGLHALQQDPKLWAGLKETVRELSSLNDVLVAPTPAQNVSVVSKRRVDWLLKQHDDKTYLFTVNGNATGTPARFTIPGLAPGRRATVLFENRDVEVGPNGIEDAFEPYQRHVYRFD